MVTWSGEKTGAGSVTRNCSLSKFPAGIIRPKEARDELSPLWFSSAIVLGCKLTEPPHPGRNTPAGRNHSDHWMFVIDSINRVKNTNVVLWSTTGIGGSGYWEGRGVEGRKGGWGGAQEGRKHPADQDALHVRSTRPRKQHTRDEPSPQTRGHDGLESWGEGWGIHVLRRWDRQSLLSRH